MNQTYAQLFKGRQPKNREMIIKVLLKLKASGKAVGTLQNISYCLAKLGRNADLAKPVEVKLFVADLDVANSYKQNLIKAYAYLTAIYDIPFSRPRYKHERKIPIIPTKENLMKIISSSKKYAVIF